MSNAASGLGLRAPRGAIGICVSPKQGFGGVGSRAVSSLKGGAYILI